jgi:hypothetical protein
MANVILIRNVIEVLRAQPTDDPDGTVCHRVPVTEERRDMDTFDQLRDLFPGHARSPLSQGQAHSLLPATLVEHLHVVRGRPIHPDILGPSHVPQVPRDGRRLGVRPRPKLLFA